MRSSLGWTLLSRDALKRAEAHLREETEGVRDEIGFLSLHQAYADRFFPGTSVLHTRLRYALFVPWHYQDLAERGGGRPSEMLQREETRLAGRLPRAVRSGEGVIGGQVFPKPTSQPPSMVYWSALGTWGILRPLPDGSWPSRQVLLRAISGERGHSRLHDDEHALLEESREFFVGLPDPPPAWKKPECSMDFALTKKEARFLRSKIQSLQRPGPEEAEALLARLVDVPLSSGSKLRSQAVRRAADARDREALTHAGQVAALSAIGRGVYAAIAEEMRDKFDRLPGESTHREHLKLTIDRYRGDALALELDSIRADAAKPVNEGILGVLRATQDWLRARPRQPVMDLHEIYESAERVRKGRRARLTRSIVGRERRAEWEPTRHALAVPVHFRWGNARRLLLDLQAAR